MPVVLLVNLVVVVVGLAEHLVGLVQVEFMAAVVAVAVEMVTVLLLLMLAVFLYRAGAEGAARLKTRRVVMPEILYMVVLVLLEHLMQLLLLLAPLPAVVRVAQ